MTFTRRHFLKTLVVSASAVTLTQITGCGSDNNDQKPAEIAAQILAVFPQSIMSGDPRTNSVILWTRVAGQAGVDTQVTVQVARDADFKQVIVDEALTALAAHDHCLKVRVVALDAGQTYYYRFLALKTASRVGRTRTAPAITDTSPVRYAFASCQDFNGRYYNVYLRLLEADMDDLAFVLHLGDYVYETDADPDFQSSGSSRQVVFDDLSGAIALQGSNGGTFHAARSLDNYRQLYRVYRGDEVLQQVHEKFPLVAMWDDHEFSDDSWQNNATYLNGVQGEGDISRKRNSEQAYFEYMPIDQDSVADETATAAGRIDLDAADLSVGSEDGAGVGSITQGSRIYRSFRWGKHLDLYLTDFRTHRPDHLIPEDAFPGTVLFNTTVANAATSFVALASLAAPTQGALGAIFTGLYTQAFVDAGQAPADAAVAAAAKVASVLTGNLSIPYLIAVVQGAEAAGSLDNATSTALQGDIVANANPASDGLSYFALGKSSLFNELGARYFVVKDSYDAFAGVNFALDATPDKLSQNAYGADQWRWLSTGLAASDATWRMLGSSVSPTPMVLGLKSALSPALTATLPVALQNDFYLNVEQWDGFAPFRDNLLIPALAPTVASSNGVVVVSGDIHSTWVSDHGNGVFAFTTASISSATFKALLNEQVDDLADAVSGGNQAAKDALLAQAGQLLSIADTIVQNSDAKVKLGRLNEHGLGVVSLDAVGMEVSFWQLLPTLGGLDMIGASFYDSPQVVVDAMFERKYRVESNTLTLFS